LKNINTADTNAAVKYVEVSGQLQAPATLPLEKFISLSPGYPLAMKLGKP
jgi:hypothetical protein